MQLAECKLPGNFLCIDCNFDQIQNHDFVPVTSNCYRMRNYVKRGSISNRQQYSKLREAVWNQVYEMDKEGIVIHGNDIQFLAMKEALKQNLPTFKVSDIRCVITANLI